MADDKHDAFLQQFRWLARYNHWFNERLYDACERLSDAERKQDRGAFFGSIHHTLNHLVWGDRLWLQRFAAQPPGFRSLPPALLALPAGAVHETVLYEEWQQLREARRALDAAIVDWTLEMAPGWPQSIMRYANTKGVPREHPAWQAMIHFFNHQTHHRGQATTLLAQAGVDVGVTDLIALV